MSGRLLLLVGFLASWFGAVAVRLYDLQVRHHDDYRRRAERQQERLVTLDPPRGTLVDARGREVAVSIEVDSAYAVPRRVADPRATAAAIAGVLPVDRRELAAALAGDREFVWVARKLDPPRAKALRDLDLEGIDFVRESKRYYPLKRLAAPLLGYVGTDNRGLAGLESRYDAVVASEPGRRTVIRDARYGTVLYPHREEVLPRPGSDLRLTLDAAIQHIVERQLERGVERYGAKSGSVVVMEPTSGAILAMASSPSFDPNRFAAYPEERWRNRPVVDAFEPGSTFKLVTVAAALEAGVVDPAREVYCEMGSITLAGVRINDHRPFGVLPVWQVIARSSNVGAIKIGMAAGRERLFATIRAFGFGRPTGVDLPGESAGLLRPLERWSPLTPAYVSFGQGISVTSLQLARAFAAVANGGLLPTPHVVEEAIGAPLAPPPEPVALPLARSTLREVESMLEAVVVEGTGKAAAVPGYRVAGKTGTAQKAVSGRGYVAGKHVASFVGYVPVGRPALVIAVTLDEPWPRYHGGDVAAPLFAAIAERTLLYLGVPPQREEPPPAAPPSLRWAAAEDGAAPPPPAGTVPDLSGLSARRAVVAAAALGLAPRLHGHGFVARQAPAAGAALEAAAGYLDIWLGARRAVAATTNGAEGAAGEAG